MFPTKLSKNMIILATRPRDAIKNGCEQCPSFFVSGGEHILLLFFWKINQDTDRENKKIINWTDGMAFWDGEVFSEV